MARVVWRGAIAFGLVHVPVALYPASQDGGIDFDWLDKRSMDPVGYKRVNKRTGKEIESDDIVRGLKVAGGEYVLLGDDEIKAAYPVSTQTIEIETFVKAGEISFVLLEKPYFLAPSDKAEKVYALLREAMLAEGVIGVARFVMHAKEHLAILVADRGHALPEHGALGGGAARARRHRCAGRGARRAEAGGDRDGDAARRRHDQAVRPCRLRGPLHRRHPHARRQAHRRRQDGGGRAARGGPRRAEQRRGSHRAAAQQPEGEAPGQGGGAGESRDSPDGEEDGR